MAAWTDLDEAYLAAFGAPSAPSGVRTGVLVSEGAGKRRLRSTWPRFAAPCVGAVRLAVVTWRAAGLAQGPQRSVAGVRHVRDRRRDQFGDDHDAVAPG